MPSTYSPNLRIELIATGEQAGTWGNTTNTNLGTLIEDAIAGYVSVSVTSANQALTANNGTADQSRNMVINLTTTTTANFNVYIPPAEKFYVIRNSSAYQATIFCSTVLGNTTAAGTGVAIPAGRETIVFSDATNVVIGMDYLPSLTLGTDLAIADGGTGASDAPTARTNLGATTVGSNMFTLTNPSAIRFTRINADNTVSALDATSFRTAIGADGTVTSVGGTGTVNGITLTGTVTSSGSLTLGGALSNVSLATQVTGTLPVANGGTGGTTQATARSSLGTVADTASNGIAARTSANTLTARTITASTGISVANGDGVSGNPTITNTGVTSVAAGTGISVSASTGGVTISASGGGGFSNIQVFTSSGTFTVPAGITKVKATVVGGGGGGGGTTPTPGGGGGTSIEIISGLTPGGTVAVTVGGGGAGVFPPSSGGTGGTSSFGAFCSATGGGGGVTGSGITGVGGIGSGGNLDFAGGAGAGNTGGCSFFGGGQRANYTNQQNGRAYGGGGSGGESEANVPGGNGAAGVVVVEW